MANIISIFNNKGGVGKTTYMFHVAHLLASDGVRVLMVDCDSQSNLTAYTLANPLIRRSWFESGNSIWRNIEEVSRGIGDIRQRGPSIAPNGGNNLFIVPGDLKLSDFEDRLGDSWSSAKGGNESALRIQSAIYRYISWAAKHVDAEIVLIDLGPNLGALNRSVLAASDYFIVPMAPDLFSIRGTENLGTKLRLWNSEWRQCHQAWEGAGLLLPPGRPKFLGYVIQSHNIRNNSRGMTRGWDIYGQLIGGAVQTNIVNVLTPLDQVVDWEYQNYNLGRIPNLHSLIPYSQRARKPVFDCSYGDGLQGNHVAKALEAKGHFSGIVEIIKSTLSW